MSVLFSWWWLGLPLMALPIWWHRQRRQQTSAQPLATARFLAQTDPRLQSVWRWRQLLLLILRLLMLACLLALVAGIFYRGRGDTIFISEQADKTWVQQQLSQSKKEAGGDWSNAKIERVCVEASCSVQTDQILPWLAHHQHEWKRGSKWLVLASASDGQISALLPQFDNALDLRISPLTSPEKLLPATISIVVKSARFAEWQAWFKVFEQTLDGRLHFDVKEQWNTKVPASLVVWESPLAPTAEWQAPLWWLSEASAFAADIENAKDKRTSESEALSALGLRAFETKQGRVWLKSANSDWPLNELGGAKRLFETWRALQSQPQGFPLQALSLPAVTTATTSATISTTKSDSERTDDSDGEKKANLDRYWMLALLSLFCLERIVNHARRT